jgi:hypothetical protein
MALPQTNATLRSVNQPSSQFRDYGEDVITGGALKWHGDVGVYFHEKRERVPSNTGMQMIIRRSLIVDAVNPPIDFERGDVLTFDLIPPASAGALVEQVQGVERRKIPGIPGTTRLTLEDG